MMKIVQGDITTLEVDAIVNAANQVMLGGGGVDGAIHRAAGKELFDACLKVPEVRPGVRCPTGEARITPGFKLPAKFVMFHTLGELCLSPVGLSLVTKLAPIRCASLLMGTWFLATALANFTAGFYSGYFGHISNVRFFTTLVIMPVIGGLLLFSIKKYVIKWMNGIR